MRPTFILGIFVSWIGMGVLLAACSTDTQTAHPSPTEFSNLMTAGAALTKVNCNKVSDPEVYPECFSEPIAAVDENSSAVEEIGVGNGEGEAAPIGAKFCDSLTKECNDGPCSSAPSCDYVGAAVGKACLVESTVVGVCIDVCKKNPSNVSTCCGCEWTFGGCVVKGSCLNDLVWPDCNSLGGTFLGAGVACSTEATLCWDPKTEEAVDCSTLPSDVIVPGDDSAQTPSQEALQAAEQVIVELDVGPLSRVNVRGPVTAGAYQVNIAPYSGSFRPFRTPSLNGTWYAVSIDPYPGAASEHPIWIAWVDAETGAMKVRANWQRVVLVPPVGQQPIFFNPPVTVPVEGIDVTFEKTKSTPLLQLADAPDENMDDEQTIWTPEKPVFPGLIGTSGCKKAAIVFDAGDQDDKMYTETLSAPSSGREFFELANKMTTDLIAQGYEIRRFSNFMDSFAKLQDNGLWTLQRSKDGVGYQSLTVETLTAALLNSIEELDAIEPDKGCCHELFVYFTGHGKVRKDTNVNSPWSLAIYPGDTPHNPPTLNSKGEVLSSDAEWWSPVDLTFPLIAEGKKLEATGRVKVNFFIESCGAGGFVTPNGVKEFKEYLCPVLCGLDIYATTDAPNWTMANSGLSVTDWYLITPNTLDLSTRWTQTTQTINNLDWETQAVTTGIKTLYGMPQHWKLCR